MNIQAFRCYSHLFSLQVLGLCSYFFFPKTFDYYCVTDEDCRLGIPAPVASKRGVSKNPVRIPVFLHVFAGVTLSNCYSLIR